MLTFKYDNVKIFPVTFNTDNSNLLSETNISEMLAALTEKRNFVASYDEGGEIEFYLQGYHCKIDSLTDVFKEATANGLWVKLVKDDNELVKSPNDYFEGLEYALTDPGPDDKNYFQLLTKEDDSWKVPAESYIRFTSQSIDIDGGEI